MPKLYLRLILFLLISANVFFVSSCSSAISLKTDENGYLADEENDRTYIDCSLSLRAKSISDAVYAKGSGDDKINLHEVTEQSPSHWLSENISTVAIPFIFREASAVPDEPTIEDFADVIHVTQTEVATMQISVIDDKAIVLKYIDEFLTNEDAILPSHDNFDYNYTLRFEGEKYPGIQYLLQYYVDNTGKRYLYDRGIKRCVILSDDLDRIK